MFKKGLDIDIKNIYKISDGRKILVNFNIGDIFYSLVNIYVLNKEICRIDFLKGMKRFIIKNFINIENIILCGDFNCYFDGENIDKSLKILSDIIDSLYLNDLWKDKYVNSSGYIWCDVNNILKSCIDYIFISIFLLIKIK